MISSQGTKRLPRWHRGKETAFNVQDAGASGSAPGWERSFGGGNGNPEKSHGQRTLVGYGTWGGKESNTTEWMSRNTQETEILHNTWLSKKKKKDVGKKGEREMNKANWRILHGIWNKQMASFCGKKCTGRLGLKSKYNVKKWKIKLLNGQVQWMH